jgi:nucleotide-binding universal stress UspA family protein
MATVLLGYDGSGCANCALKAALELCGQLGDRLVIAYAYGPPGRRLSGEELAEHRRALEEIGEQMTGEALQRAQEAGVEAETVLVDATPAEGLRRLAGEVDARMIVVGTQGESPLRSAILGSTPHKLLQLSERPVLVIPPEGVARGD